MTQNHLMSIKLPEFISIPVNLRAARAYTLENYFAETYFNNISNQFMYVESIYTGRYVYKVILTTGKFRYEQSKCRNFFYLFTPDEPH